MSKTVAQVMVEQLASWGVKHVFGVVGDGIFYLLDALARQQAVRFYAVRHEETAALMAAAFAKLTGQPAVCIGTTGPGMVHLLNGLADAGKDRVPLIAITGQVARQDIGTHQKQYIDQQALVQSLVAYTSLLADPLATIEVMNQAYKSAISQNMPTLITVPMDVFNLPCNLTARPPEPYLFTSVYSDDAVIKNAMPWFNNAVKPVILAGVGARKAASQVVQLAEKWGAGVIYTLGGVGVISGEHPLALGGLGHAGSVSSDSILREADVCFCIGVNWWPQDYTPQQVSLIELDDKPEHVGAAGPVAYGMVGEAERVLPRIASLLTPADRRNWCSQIEKAHTAWHNQVNREAHQDGSQAVPPACIVSAMSRLLEPDAIICLDTGDHTIWFGRNFIPKQQRVILSGKWRTMGFGLAAALACKIADANRQVVALVGDGGFAMLLADFTTAVKYNLPVVIIVVNNGGLIEEKNRMLAGHLIPAGVHLHNPDFASFAQGCGGAGFRVESAEQMEPVLQQALGCGKAAIVDVYSAQTVVPRTKMN
ncbi:pyruvate oxidase [Desulfotomaculum varum]